MKTIVRPYSDSDLLKVAQIHAETFPRQARSDEWISCNAQAHPRMRYYVAESEGDISGYILWVEKSGFRSRVVLELEQIAVRTEFRNQGIGAALIERSLANINIDIAGRDAELGVVLITTRADNHAQWLYRKTLGAEVAAIIPSLYSGDELLMVARSPLQANSELNPPLVDQDNLVAQHLNPSRSIL